MTCLIFLQLLHSISSSKIQPAESLSIPFLHTFNTYTLLARIPNTRTHQLNLIKTFSSSKSCTPHHLLHLGLSSTSPEVSDFALDSSLSAFLSCPCPDYRAIARAVRRLIMIRKDDAFCLYKRAYGIMVGLKEGEWPAKEGKWLATTAWNRSGNAVRMREVEEARKWMGLGLEFVRRVKGMERYVEGMEESVKNFEKICNSSGDRDNET